MNQKQFERHFKEQMKKFSQNMCVICAYNDTCELPLHGHYSHDGAECPHARHMPEEQMALWALETFYGPALREKRLKTR